MTAQPTASYVAGAGHGGAMPGQQQIEKIHNSEYGVMREGEGHDPTDGSFSEWFLVMKKVSGEYMPMRRFAHKDDAMQYIQTQLKALRGRGRKSNTGE